MAGTMQSDRRLKETADCINVTVTLRENTVRFTCRENKETF